MCTTTGSFSFFAKFKIHSTLSISCPSTGPKYLKPKSSKNIFGITNCFMLYFTFLAKCIIGGPTLGTFAIIFLILLLDFL